MRRLEMAYYRLVTWIIPLLVVACLGITGAESGCTPDQIKGCKQAATKGKLSTYYTGGTCSEKSYIHYTHMCVINNNEPGAESCCCVSEGRVMCCKYKQAWDMFRCSQAEDTVDNISPFSGRPDSSGFKTPPLKILIPAIVIPLLLIGFCIFCGVKCCCYGDNQNCCCGKSRSTKKKRKQRKSNPQPSGLVPGEGPDRASESGRSAQHMVASQYSTNSTGSEAKLLPSETDSLASPTATSPVYPDRGFNFSHGGYSRLCSNSSSGVLQPVPEGQRSDAPRIVMSSQFSTESHAKLLPAMDDPIAPPTAPPYEAGEFDFSCPPHRMSGGCDEPATSSAGIIGQGDQRDGSTPVALEPSIGRSSGEPCQHTARYTCPPPAYDEHHKDPILR